MQVKEKEVILSKGVVVRWEAVDTLRVLGDRLIFHMRDGVQLEVSGLPLKEVDALFTEYARYVVSVQGSSALPAKHRP